MKVLVIDATVGIIEDQDCICLVLLCLNPHRTTKKVVSHHHHEEGKSYCPSCSSGSSR